MTATLNPQSALIYVMVIVSAPIHIPENAGKAELEMHRQKVEHALNVLTDYAEQLASR